MKRSSLVVAVSTFALAILSYATSALGQDATRVVLKGYDPVAYFTEGKPVKGDPKLSFDFDEGRYYFASPRHRDMFAANPEKYAPQFGGYCTGSMARGVSNEADPDGWTIRDGKLYVFGAAKWKDVAEKDAAYLPSKVPEAAKNWSQKKGRAS